MTGTLNGFTIGVTADRRAEDQLTILRGRGADCIHGPTIRTRPLRSDADIRTVTEDLLVHPPCVVVLNTGIGVRGWLEAADSLLLGEELRDVLSKATLVSRGPKARGAAVTADLEVAWNAPNATLDEVVEYLGTLNLVGQRVVVQLDGSTENNVAGGVSALAAIEAMGAEVVPVAVYRWSLPDDAGPAEALLKGVVEGRVDALTFTARPAVENLVIIAERLGMLEELVEACSSKVKLFCIGPVCATGVIEHELGEPLQPERARLGALMMLVTAALGGSGTTLTMGGMPVTIRGRTVTIPNGEPTQLTTRERQLLDVLLERPGVVHSKASLLKSVWGPQETDTHVVEVTVGRLRRRLGPAGAGVQTVTRRGYRIRP